jgi:gamma-glutamylaminecyclotransferase
MCVILIKDDNNIINEQLLKNSMDKNPDGLGVVWLDSNEITYHESKDIDILRSERPYIAHFRYATVGEVSLANCHPFPIGDTGEYLMQNGTVRNLGSKKMTDTEHLANLLALLPRHTWREVLEMTDCRFVITDLHSYDVYNDDLWFEYEGVWVSKENVLPNYIKKFSDYKNYYDPFDDRYLAYDEFDDQELFYGDEEYIPVAVYGTLKVGHNNYNHYLKDAEYIGSGVTAEKYPLIINGLPYVLNKPGDGQHIEVDVFYVNKSQLKDLDALEGHPNWYYRDEIQVVMDDSSVEYAFIYFNDTVEDNGVHHKSYTQHNKYLEF